MTGAVGHQLLDDIGHAVERPVRRRWRVVVEIRDGVQRGVEPAEVRQRRIEHVLRRELALLDEVGDGERVVRREQVVHVG